MSSLIECRNRLDKYVSHTLLINCAGFNATLTAKVIIIVAVSDSHVFPDFLTPVLTQLSFQSHRLLFSHASEVRGETTPERKFASAGYRAHNHQVISQRRSPLHHGGGGRHTL